MTLYSMEYPCEVGARGTGTMVVNLDHFVYSKAIDGRARRFLPVGRGDYEVRFIERTFVIERDEWAKMKAVLSRMSQRGVNVLGEEPEELPDPRGARIETPREVFEEAAASSGLRFSFNDSGSMTAHRILPYPNPSAIPVATATATTATAGGAS